ncbi:MAG: lipopolysaccharide biosynthesis protein [Acidimicrobiales bacterium]
MSSDSRRSLLGRVSGDKSRLSAAALGSMAVAGTGTVLRFALQIVLARGMGSSGYGLFVTYRGWGELLATLPNRGYQAVVVRTLPAYADVGAGRRYHQLVRHSLRTVAIGGAAIAGVSMASVAVAGSAEPGLYLGLISVPLWALLRMVQAVLQAQHRYALGTLLADVMQPALLGLVVGVIWLVDRQLGPATAVGALLVSVGSSALLSYLLARREFPDPTSSVERAEQDPGPWPSPRPFFVAHLAIAVLGMADVLILAMFVTPAEVALYAIASRIANLGRMVNSSLESVASARIAAAWAKLDTVAIQTLVNRSIALGSVLTIILVTPLVIFRGSILGLVGEEYRGAATALIVLLIGNMVSAFTGPAGYVVALTGGQVIHARVMAAAAVALVAGCLVFGSLGIVAVAAVRAATTFGWNAALVIDSRARLGVACYPNRGFLTLLGKPAS